MFPVVNELLQTLFVRLVSSSTLKTMLSCLGTFKNILEKYDDKSKSYICSVSFRFLVERVKH